MDLETGSPLTDEEIETAWTRGTATGIPLAQTDDTDDVDTDTDDVDTDTTDTDTDSTDTDTDTTDSDSDGTDA